MSGEYKYSHLSEDLHVEIQTFAPPAEAHARIAYALAEVRRFLVPVSEFIKLHEILFSFFPNLLQKAERQKRLSGMVLKLNSFIRRNRVPIRVSIQFNSILST